MTYSPAPRRVLLLFTLGMMTLQAWSQAGQGLHWDVVKLDPTLTSPLLNRNDTVKDSIWIKGGLDQFFNQPINAGCITTGDFPPGDTDSLIFCDCLKLHDTILIQLTSPSACCYTTLHVFLVGNRFRVSAEFSYDISPQPVYFQPGIQQLILRKAVFQKGALLEGYLLFQGTGKSTSTSEEKSSTHILKGQAKGYFKCRLK